MRPWLLLNNHFQHSLLSRTNLVAALLSSVVSLSWSLFLHLWCIGSGLPVTIYARCQPRRMKKIKYRAKNTLKQYESLICLLLHRIAFSAFTFRDCLFVYMCARAFAVKYLCASVIIFDCVCVYVSVFCWHRCSVQPTSSDWIGTFFNTEECSISWTLMSVTMVRAFYET